MSKSKYCWSIFAVCLKNDREACVPRSTTDLVCDRKNCEQNECCGSFFSPPGKCYKMSENEQINCNQRHDSSFFRFFQETNSPLLSFNKEIIQSEKINHISTTNKPVFLDLSITKYNKNLYNRKFDSFSVNYTFKGNKTPGYLIYDYHPSIVEKINSMSKLLTDFNDTHSLFYKTNTTPIIVTKRPSYISMYIDNKEVFYRLESLNFEGLEPTLPGQKIYSLGSNKNILLTKISDQISQLGFNVDQSVNNPVFFLITKIIDIKRFFIDGKTFKLFEPNKETPIRLFWEGEKNMTQNLLYLNNKDVIERFSCETIDERVLCEREDFDQSYDVSFDVAADNVQKSFFNNTLFSIKNRVICGEGKYFDFKEIKILNPEDRTIETIKKENIDQFNVRKLYAVSDKPVTDSFNLQNCILGDPKFNENYVCAENNQGKFCASGLTTKINGEIKIIKPEPNMLYDTGQVLECRPFVEDDYIKIDDSRFIACSSNKPAQSEQDLFYCGQKKAISVDIGNKTLADYCTNLSTTKTNFLDCIKQSNQDYTFYDNQNSLLNNNTWHGQIGNQSELDWKNSVFLSYSSMPPVTQKLQAMENIQSGLQVVGSSLPKLNTEVLCLTQTIIFGVFLFLSFLRMISIYCFLSPSNDKTK